MLNQKEREKLCQFFIVPGSSPALLGMPEIETLGILAINYEHSRQDVDIKIKCNAVEMAESCSSRRQDVDAQKQYNADNTAKPDVVPNAIVTGSNNNKNQSFFSDPLINDYLGFLSEQFRRCHKVM